MPAQAPALQVDQSYFRYAAIDVSGRSIRGVIAARNEGAAFELLKKQGLAPLRMRQDGRASQGVRISLNDRDAADLLVDLAALLDAGANIRSALAVIGAKGVRSNTKAICQQLLNDISGGAPLEGAFARALGPRRAHVPAIIAAGEASGDMPGSLRRAGEMLGSQIRIRDQLVSTLAYPSFVLATALFAMGIILLVVVPALAPLVEQSDERAPLALSVLVSTSAFVRGHSLLLMGAAGSAVIAIVGLARTGILLRLTDAVALRGPFKSIACPLVFGGFSVTAGTMLSAGTPMADALRLAIRSVRSPIARTRLEPVTPAIREGRTFSEAISKVRDFPQSIARLAVIGETSGALGPMVARAGKIEEDAALRRIEMTGRMIGPAVIVILGALIGLLMAGLLSGITHIGDSALQ